MPRELGVPLLDAVIDRTNEGAEALMASVKVAAKEPERNAFFASHAVTVAARAFGWRRALAVSEPLMLPMLAGTALRHGRTTGRKAALAVALAGGTAAERARSKSPDKATGKAAVAASSQYTAYAVALQGAYRPKLNPVSLAARVGLVAGGVGLALWKNRDVALATVAGGLPLAVVGAAAADPGVRRVRSPHARGLGHGANLVFVGEGLNLLRATALRGRSGAGARLLSAGAVGLSSLGQMMLVDGIARRR